MKLLEDRIRADGQVLDAGVLRVDSFLNHQLDPELLVQLGQEFYRLFEHEHITKILTVEASGIAVACAAGQFFRVPVVFAKKSRSKNITGEVYSAQVESFTHGCVNTILVSRRFLLPQDRVLLLDDFLANGAALRGLMELVRQSGAALVGAGVCIEKAFQPGGGALRQMGVRVEALARIQSMDPRGGIQFVPCSP